MNEVLWKPDQMLEVNLNEPDDFLKVRETLSRIGVDPLVKVKPFINPVIFYINKANTILCILKNYLH